MRACINIFSFSHLFNLLHFSISVSNNYYNYCRVTPVHFSSYVNGTEILSGLVHLSFYLEAFPDFFQPLIILLFFNVCLPQISAINPPDLFTYKNLHSLTKLMQSLTHILAKSQLCIPYHRNLENEKIAFFTYNGIKVATKAFFGLQ